MTEKRFIKGYHTIRDTNENKVYDFRVDIICNLLNELDGKWVDEFSLRETLQLELQRVENENEQLKKQIGELEFKLRTIEAYDRTVKEEHSDTVYDFKKKLEKW